MEKLLVLGAGESGAGAAVLAKAGGFEVLVSDSGTIEPRYLSMLEERAIACEQGGHAQAERFGAGLAIKSPGIPDTAPIVRHLTAQGVEVISEIEFAGRYAGDSRTICVTGSNGKTTTATLIHRILTAAGFDAALSGNIGRSFALSVAEGHHDWYVLELSSFQLDGMREFKADIAVLTNITPDHLDRYDHDFGKYAESKMGIVRNQSYDDFFIYCGDDPATRLRVTGVREGENPAAGSREVEGRESENRVVEGRVTENPVTRSRTADRQLGMRLLPFTSGGEEGLVPAPGHTHTHTQGAFVTGGDFVATVGDRRFAMPVTELGIKGRHNLYNAMAASLAAMAAGVPDDSIRSALTSFTGVEHRMENLGMIAGVEYINDSKATNVDSAWYALESMTRPVVWIAGGTDKGNDYAPLRELVRGKVRALVCMGLDNGKLMEAFAGDVERIYDAHSLDEAMEAVAAEAASGDTVLLSPACASFDLFKNYEDRGRQFKRKVGELKNAVWE